MEKYEDISRNKTYEIHPAIRKKLEKEKQDCLIRLAQDYVPSLIKTQLEEAVAEIDEILGVEPESQT